MDSTNNTGQTDLEKKEDARGADNIEATNDRSVNERIDEHIQDGSSEAATAPGTDIATPTEDLPKDPATKKQKKALRKIAEVSGKLGKSLAKLDRYQWLLEDLASRMRMVQANLKQHSNQKDRKMLKKELATEKSLLKSLESKSKKTKKRVLELQGKIDALKAKAPASK